MGAFFAGTLIYSFKCTNTQHSILFYCLSLNLLSSHCKRTRIYFGFPWLFNTILTMYSIFTPSWNFPHFVLLQPGTGMDFIGVFTIQFKTVCLTFGGVKQKFLCYISIHPLGQYSAAGLQWDAFIGFAHLDPDMCSRSSWQNCSSSVKLDGSVRN